MNEKRIPERRGILFVRKYYNIENERRIATRRKVKFPRVEASWNKFLICAPATVSFPLHRLVKSLLVLDIPFRVTTRKLDLPLTSTTRYERERHRLTIDDAYESGMKTSDLRSQRGHAHLLVNLGYGIELRFPRKRFGANERARCARRVRPSG